MQNLPETLGKQPAHAKATLSWIGLNFFPAETRTHLKGYFHQGCTHTFKPHQSDAEVMDCNLQKLHLNTVLKLGLVY